MHNLLVKEELMRNRDYRDDDERTRGEFSGGPYGRKGLGGDYARDTHREGFGDDYARDGGWSGAGRADDYARDSHWGGTGAPGAWSGGRGPAAGGNGPGQMRGTYGTNNSLGGSAFPYGGTDPSGRPSYRGRGPKNWRPTDERIRDNVNELLTDHDDVDATDVEVRVENGEVTLDGTVASRWEKRLAEDIAASCRGVYDVHNRLRISDRETHIGKASE